MFPSRHAPVTTNSIILRPPCLSLHRLNQSGRLYTIPMLASGSPTGLRSPTLPSLPVSSSTLTRPEPAGSSSSHLSSKRLRADPCLTFSSGTHHLVQPELLCSDGNGTFSNLQMGGAVVIVAWVFSKFIPYFGFKVRFITGLLVTGLPTISEYTSIAGRTGWDLLLDLCGLPSNRWTRGTAADPTATRLCRPHPPTC